MDRCGVGGGPLEVPATLLACRGRPSTRRPGSICSAQHRADRAQGDRMGCWLLRCKSRLIAQMRSMAASVIRPLLN